MNEHHDSAIATPPAATTSGPAPLERRIAARAKPVRHPWRPARALQFGRRLLELIRFSHTVFALPFALLAAILAWGLEGGTAFGARPLLGILLCMVFARSAAMAFNRLVDRQFDAENPRTAGRHLPARLLSVGQVTLFTWAMAGGFVASTALFWPNRLPLVLSLPVLAFLGGYSYAKRFTALAHVWLGAALSLAPICTWLALRGEVVLVQPSDLAPAALLGAAVLAWVAGFDMIYACQDVDFDRAAGLWSMATRLGVRRALAVAAGAHALVVLLLAGLPLVHPGLGRVFWGGVCGIAGLLAWEHSLVRPDDLSRVNQAFFHVNAVISLGLLVVGAVDVWLF